MSDEQPRQPRNLQGLLKFAMEATKSEDAQRPSEFHRMSDEDRKFLEEALKSMTIDVVEELTKAIRKLDGGNASEDDQIEALEVVTSFISDIDTANDFYKIGGFSILEPCLNSEYSEVRSETALLIGELAQNNEYCQKHLLDLKIMPKLLELMSKDDGSVANHALHAISCISRNYEPGMKEFIAMGGLECLLACTGSENEKLAIKSFFLISAMAQENPVCEQLVKLNAVEKIVPQIEVKAEYCTKLEQALRALVTLSESSEGQKRCRNKELGLLQKLDLIISSSKGKEECQEQIEYSQTLKKRISK